MYKRFYNDGIDALPKVAPQSYLRDNPLAATSLFGLKLVNATMARTADHLVARAASGRRTTVNFVNAHCINVAARDKTYRHQLAESDLLLPDGSGMRIAARLAGTDFGDNLNGTDLFPALCERAARHGLPIYLLGGTPGTAARAAETMQRRYPALVVAGTQHGFFDAQDEAQVLDRINQSGAALVFVGFGVPVQERWIAANRDRLNVAVVLGVGGLFDYYAGNVSRAPAMLRRIGCEWVWRLAQEPQRLAKRYLWGNLSFLARAAVHASITRLFARGLHPATKRALDFSIALGALVALSPILLGVAFAIRREDGGPALFRQRRIGANGKPFTMFKFRSMVLDAEARREELLARSERDGVCFKMKRDPRITRVGAWIRKTSIDELPQLINVLRGDMSIVGPRPALPDEVVTYAGRSWGRLGGKPGITCTWQVSGRAEIPFEQQVVMDIDYLGKRSVLHDIALMFRTVPAVLSRRGAY